MNRVLQARLHIIFCLRADEKIEIVKEGNKTKVVPLGWMPICEKRFMYEMTVSFTLAAENDGAGKPNPDLPHKCPDHLAPFFPVDQRISEEAGRRLAVWARGDTPPAPTIDPAILARLIEEGELAATMTGRSAVDALYKRLTKPEREHIGSDRWKQWIAKAEANTAGVSS
jgi:hypothetical protein